jgi:hypothetical protein
VVDDGWVGSPGTLLSPSRSPSSLGFGAEEALNMGSGMTAGGSAVGCTADFCILRGAGAVDSVDPGPDESALLLPALRLAGRLPEEVLSGSGLLRLGNLSPVHKVLRVFK